MSQGFGRRACVRLFAVLAVLLASSRAGAEDITGRVADETGGVLAGAKVEVTSATVVNFNKTATTDRNGTFKVAVPPGTYVVIVEKTHFLSYANGAVEVAAGQPTNLDIQLAIALQEQVTVEETAGAV